MEFVELLQPLFNFNKSLKIFWKSSFVDDIVNTRECSRV